MKHKIYRTALNVPLWTILSPAMARAQENAKDWPMYNRDVLGTRHNQGETGIGRDNASRLVEKWRFPAAGSDLEIGVIHATPVVVGRYVYFGTATDPTFYKLTPDGTVKWSYRNPAPSGRRRGSPRHRPPPRWIWSRSRGIIWPMPQRPCMILQACIG